ncbi:MAG: DUF2975 domain-containing protein [Bacteroidota bacterium]|nr:DUF2975 domain-containing protein [Bacteroidota bacterium]
MNRSTTFLLKFMRYAFLLITVGGAVALTAYVVEIVAHNPQPGAVVTVNVRELSPRFALLQNPEHAPNAAEQAVAAGHPAQYQPWGSSGQLIYREANPVMRVAMRLITSRPQSVPYVLATTLFCLLVYRILRDIRPGVPFTPANVRRLRGLGLLLIGCDVYHWTSSWWLARHLAAVAPAGLAGLQPVSPFGSSLVANWLIGLMLLIVAAGYQRGVELAEDAELTV